MSTLKTKKDSSKRKTKSVKKHKQNESEKPIVLEVSPENEIENIRYSFLENTLDLVKSTISSNDIIEIRARLSRFNEHLEQVCSKLPEGTSVFKNKTCILNLTNLLKRLVIKVEHSEPKDKDSKEMKIYFLKSLPGSLEIIKNIE